MISAFLWAINFALWVYFAYLTLNFQYGHNNELRPIEGFVAWWLLSFVLYAISCWWFVRKKNSWKLILVMGFLFRILLIPTNPVQEDDFYRYLWDGATLKRGINPYLFAPQEVISFEIGDKCIEAAEKLRELELRGELPFDLTSEEAIDDLTTLLVLKNRLVLNELQEKDFFDFELKDNELVPIVSRVNHKQFPTVYPPLAQVTFFSATQIREGSLWVLRGIFIIFECLTCLLIVKVLQRVNLSTSQVSWYALNPLVIKEFVNSPHLDVILVTCAAAFICLWCSNRYILATLMAGLGVLAKLLTGIFIPFIFVWSKRARWAVPFSLLIIFCGFWSFSDAGERQWQSMQVMGKRFRMNSPWLDLIEPQVAKFLDSPDDVIQTFHPFHLYEIDVKKTGATIKKSHLYSRRILLALSLFWLALIWARSLRIKGHLEQINCLGVALVGFLLLSPIANPWYFGIVMLFLPFRPCVGTLVLGAALGLYYSRFLFAYLDLPSGYEYSFKQVVWAEWGAILVGFSSAFYLKNQKPLVKSS